MITEHITCDVCESPKRESNHWIAACIVSPTPEMPEERCIAFIPMTQLHPNDNEEGEIKHLCGQACAGKLLSQWFDGFTSSERRTS